ncbi:hypothetical protein HPB51_008197 [Rhipicephalus microplus]|uniref:Uncharacterized protein n=1 Tax=Rhipicephalus microplus TaxID=6941 RepID=A0A9J6EFZ8_RHIMP|nr:hypothetical protein HPB51_008197 [Rhipicephalus microplus]
MKNHGVCSALACAPLALLLATVITQAFPQGGPAESCDSMLPRHVYTAPKPAHESPYTFVASSNRFSYQNVDGIQGTILKGDFLQTRTQKKRTGHHKVRLIFLLCVRVSRKENFCFLGDTTDMAQLLQKTDRSDEVVGLGILAGGERAENILSDGTFRPAFGATSCCCSSSGTHDGSQPVNPYGRQDSASVD